MRLLTLLVFTTLFVLPRIGQAQEHALRIRVLDPSGSALPGAIVQLEPSGAYLLTNQEGNGIFQAIGPGALRLRAQMMGFETLDTLFAEGQTPTALTLTLKSRSLELQEVTVTAKENTSGLGTSSLIEREAIAHVQPNSLRDVLQLIPGQLAINPSVNTPQQILIRQVSTNGAGNAVAQMGTAIVMDGSPLSNDANLQANVNILNSSPGAPAPFQSVANQGFDLRQIPADQIESVEVLRGIGSARHGNFTAGAVLVQTRIGDFKPNLTLRANPNALQLSGGAGYRLGERHAISADVDAMDSRPDPRDVFNRFFRRQATLGHQYSGLAGDLLIRNRLTLGNSTASRALQADQDPSQRSWESEDRLFRWNAQLIMQGNNTWYDRLEGTFALTRNAQNSFFTEFITTNVGPRPTFFTDTTGVVPFGPARYLNITTVEGNPLNYYHRLEWTKSLRLGNVAHKLVLGSELRHDVNRGAGRQFDLETPPRQNFSAGDRPRTFDEVPALNQVSAYLEDRFLLRLGGKIWSWQAGLRMDHYFLSGPEQRVIGTDWQPRLQTALALHPKHRLRAGYGVHAKVPGLNFLSPGPRFIDLINFNFFAPDPDERLLVVTTRRIEPDVRELRSFLSRKGELSMEGELGSMRYTVNAFIERTSGGPSFVRQPFIAARGLFEVEALRPGQPPLLSESPTRFDTLFLAFDAPVNNRGLVNQGVEFALDFPEWKVLKTALSVNGAYIRTKSTVEGEEINPNFIFRHVNAPFIPFFQAGQGNLGRQFNTSFRFIHRFPQAGLVLSSLVQVVWVQEDQVIGFDPLPTAFLNRRGEVFRVSPEEAQLPEFVPFHNLTSPEQLLPVRRPPLTLVNFRMNKEFQAGRGFAFFVNNLFNHRPLFQDPRNVAFVQRNLSLFFGAEVFYRL
ncbi:tonb-dependent receptor [Nitritalea halalkaliphila LW7]|uniref:Tonb-dependent receptor n=1 Tax=Nitritalea halalkaliphila LW7 TaxID=1189621 RepID=I5BX07_9BACT|nr:TonB-dependent receptor plug domain-containing protein [Nitritalea halalkaliphila]EIM74109.1 tonb-dependent receptor [Nitritalea halalkaliphila LW7]